MKINWINGFNAGNKKQKYELNFRLGTFTVLEIKLCLCENCENKKAYCSKFRLMILNLGFEI
tara:strand:+ start:328 stop:513 length:186 start_codon:yes stop_codon:yes gene_type:complete